MMMTLLMALLVPRAAQAQGTSCPLSALLTLPEILTSCCEAQPGGTCDAGLPARCPQTCAGDVLEVYDRCTDLIVQLPDDHFPGLSMAAVGVFADSCRQIQVLLERGRQAGCADRVQGLETRVDLVTDECCVQEGRNNCVGGNAPTTCDAACALAFIPYFVECVEKRGPGPASGDLRVFAELEDQCSNHLKLNETAILLAMVTDRDDNPQCSIDTESILSAHDAKVGPPPCDTDTMGSVCEMFISSGTFSCEEDFCHLCEQAHACDQTCELPCEPAESDEGGQHRLLAEIPEILGFARTDAPSCNLNQFEHRLDAMTSACCVDPVNCEGGLSESCSYSCGKVFVPFLTDCEHILRSLNAYDSEQSDAFAAYRNSCLEIDPKTAVMAIHESECIVCGDGAVDGDEECDEGEQNSEEPDAQCRTNCELAKCGDGVVDSGEECDDGPLNSAEEMMTGPADQASCTVSCVRQHGPSTCQDWYDAGHTSSRMYELTLTDGGAPMDVYCDFEDVSRGTIWTIPVFPSDGNPSTPASTPAYKSFCEQHGVPLAGRGVGTADAWLAQKRMLWHSHHPLAEQGWPDGGPHLSMPISKNPATGQCDTHTLYSVYDDSTVEIPDNIRGDHCTNDCDQPVCGYWYSAGWADSDMHVMPDPEDFGPANGRLDYISCMHN